MMSISTIKRRFGQHSYCANSIHAAHLRAAAVLQQSTLTPSQAGLGHTQQKVGRNQPY
jgi:hypothetical protein